MTLRSFYLELLKNGPDIISILMIHLYLFLLASPKHPKLHFPHRFIIFFKEPIPDASFPLIDSSTVSVLTIE
jgi:hypothetical protein